MIDFGINDSGIYICKSRNTEDNDTTFTYVIDGKINTVQFRNSLYSYNHFFILLKYSGTLPGNTFHLGTLLQWQDYKNIVLDPINEMFERSKEDPFLKFKKDFKFSFKLFTLWGNWGPCITNNNGTIVRFKIGKCFLYPHFNNASSVRNFIFFPFYAFKTFKVSYGGKCRKYVVVFIYYFSMLYNITFFFLSRSLILILKK